MKVAEGSVNGGSEFDDDGLPPIRSGVISLSGNSTQVSIYVHEAFSLDEISKPWNPYLQQIICKLMLINVDIIYYWLKIELTNLNQSFTYQKF